MKGKESRTLPVCSQRERKHVMEKVTDREREAWTRTNMSDKDRKGDGR